MHKAKTRKRPCRICRRWFLPDVRQQGRQKTCGRPECKRQWHRKQCAAWNKKNRCCFKAAYLAKKLDRVKRSCKDPPLSPKQLSRPSIKLDLPTDVICEAVGAEHAILLEYVAGQIARYQRLCLPWPALVPEKSAV